MTTTVLACVWTVEDRGPRILGNTRTNDYDFCLRDNVLAIQNLTYLRRFERN